VFSGAGDLPQNLNQVQERVKDIQYASKTRFNTTRIKEIEELRSSLRRLLDKLPKALLVDPDVQRLTTISTRGAVALVHFINRHNTRSANFKDYEFSRATVTDLWEGGLEDARRSIDSPEWREATDLGNGIRIYDLTR
jgi:NTE family protein